MVRRLNMEVLARLRDYPDRGADRGRLSAGRVQARRASEHRHSNSVQCITLDPESGRDRIPVPGVLIRDEGQDQ